MVENNIAVGIGLSTDKDPTEAVREAFHHAKIGMKDKKISLAFVFSTVTLTYSGLLKTVSIFLQGIPIIGCSSAAIISNQGVFRHGVIIMLLSIPNDIHFNTADVRDIKEKTALGAGKELAEKLLYGFKNIRRDFSVIFSDGLIEEGSNFISGLQERLGSSFPLIGASASDNFIYNKTYVYSNEGVFNNAACGVLWGGKLNFGLGIKHGWKPLGKPRIITKSEANIVYEIDDFPAVNLYQEYLSASPAELKKQLRRISTLYPMGIYLPGEEEYLLRNIVSIEEDGSLLCQGNVPLGSQIRLMIGTKESCLSATEHACEEAKRGLGIHNPDFVFVFNSVSRYTLFGRYANKEIEIIKKHFGKDTPIIGFYTYGEQAPLQAIDYRGKAYFHNQTITILTIGS